MNYHDILIQPLKGNRYKTCIEIKYKEVIVPKGFITNGASIPRIFWTIIPPNKSDMIPAVIVHDFLCQHDMYALADTYLEEIMHQLGVDMFHIRSLLWSVKSWHKVAYTVDGSPRLWLKTYFKYTVSK